MINKIIINLFFASLCSCYEEFNQEVFNVPEGSNCTWRGLYGECTSIHNCRSARDGLQWNIRPPICSFQGKTPIVCCTVFERIHNTKEPITEVEIDSRLNETGSKAEDSCLKFLTKLNYPCSINILHEEKNYDDMEPVPLEDAHRIHPLEVQINSRRGLSPPFQENMSYFHGGGQPAISHGIETVRHQFPHMALLGYGEDITTAQWLCGGSIISEKYILTAAHCISSPAVGPVKYVTLGILKRTDPDSLFQKHNVRRVIPHPEYKPPSKYNDIALLETEDTISFNQNVLPACLHLKPEADEEAEATGWGSLGHRLKLADVLQWVNLQRYDQEKCSELYPKHRHLRYGYNHTTQMCYGDPEVPRDTCQGDSGGPLQIRNGMLNCAYTVIGVTSYGRECGISAGPGIYTRVYHYVPWIESIVWP